MEKKRYFISVQARTIMLNQGDAAYELEIQATDDEVDKLNELFESLEEFDQSTYFRAHYPGIPYHHDKANDGYDYFLREIYNTLYDLGTDETRQHISAITDSLNSMGEI
ncbi:hypothetical protein [Cohnella sp. REN36]|uniref:hypothetical protein n=1 Tax=Cohnella sp. REN36 TaxID=2887347 RepID=UPI001D13954B|nr:hypothetical protein [Cohnella sp. REN36]MCC3377136.1 hypothetical protein [Cohnella sp. REN36]